MVTGYRSMVSLAPTTPAGHSLLTMRSEPAYYPRIRIAIILMCSLPESSRSDW